MKRYLFTAMVLIFLISGNLTVHASTKNIDEDIKRNNEKIEILKDKEEDNKKEKKSKQEKIESLILEIEILKDENKEMKLEIEDNNKEIKKTKKEISEAEKEIRDLEESIEKRKEIADERMLRAQEKGNISYLDVLLGAESFTDLISRAYLMSTIMEADNNLIEGLMSDIEVVDKKIKSVEKKKKKLEDKKKENKEKQEKIEDKIKSITKKKKKLDKQVLELDMNVKKVKEKQKELINEVNNKVKEKEKLIKEQEMKKQKELLKLQMEKEKKVKTSKEVSKEVSMAKSVNMDNVPSKKSDVSSLGGDLEWPTDGGYISSGIGNRVHPVTGEPGRLHKGIDIARTDRSTIPPIYAAESGVVVLAGPLGGYGNMIKIKHDNGIETIYAHLSKISVNVGQKVKRGETIGIMGSTGMSTGIHLHFEVYENGELQNPLGYF